jgi:hypothetical protein
MTLSDLQRPDLSVHFPRVTIARAVELGCDEKALLHAVRLSAGMLADSRTLVSPKQLGSLLRYIWRELDDEMMGFSAPHRFGVFALMARQMVDSATLGDALRYAVRFSNLTSPAVRWQLEEGEEFAGQGNRSGSLFGRVPAFNLASIQQLVNRGARAPCQNRVLFFFSATQSGLPGDVSRPGLLR